MTTSTTRRALLSLALSLTAAAAAAACTDSAPPPSGKDGLGLGIEGIYKVDARTHDAAACAPGGDSILGSDTFAVVTSASALGISLVQVNSCASPDDCRAKAADLANGSGFLIDFNYTVGADETDGAFHGTGASTGFDDGDGTCTMGELTATALTVTGTTLQIDQQITVAADYPAGSDHLCTSDATKVAAAGKACSQYEQLTAELVGAL